MALNQLFFSSRFIPPSAAISNRGPLQHGQVMHLQTNVQDFIAFAVCLFALGIIKAFWTSEPRRSLAIYFWFQLKSKEMVWWWVCFSFFLIKAISSRNSRTEIVTHQPSKKKKKKIGLFVFLAGFISTWEQACGCFWCGTWVSNV